jgi:hypothetical protein
LSHVEGPVLVGFGVVNVDELAVDIHPIKETLLGVPKGPFSQLSLGVHDQFDVVQR